MLAAQDLGSPYRRAGRAAVLALVCLALIVVVTVLGMSIFDDIPFLRGVGQIANLFLIVGMLLSVASAARTFTRGYHAYYVYDGGFVVRGRDVRGVAWSRVSELRVIGTGASAQYLLTSSLGKLLIGKPEDGSVAFREAVLEAMARHGRAVL
ncbi:hypothetical protein KIH74_04230 [Kineosporia sp. J2-2]|uniref:PH domain-containing protein n=1 Tax=Kineosporia corallincola TaxID=2835133 RepID=A0ABS5TAN0_9ACTN|nr:hypothetical protein [Kineosporia corallincola]MBT0768115.1 hypothetical protein [Kineosporia corallincola]